MVLTTRELARMIKQAGIDFANLPDEDFDALLGESHRRRRHLRRHRRRDGGGAAHRLRARHRQGAGASRVQRRSAAWQGVKEAICQDRTASTVKVAVAHGTGERGQDCWTRSGAARSSYHFIEIMGCPGGCVTGGGQPIVSAPKRMECDPRGDPRRGAVS